MSTVLFSFKTDDKTKQEIKEFSAELGMPMTTFVNTVVRQALRDRRVVLSTGLEPTPYLQEFIKEAEADYKAGKNITTLNNGDDVDNFFKNLR